MTDSDDPFAEYRSSGPVPVPALVPSVTSPGQIPGQTLTPKGQTLQTSAPSQSSDDPFAEYRGSDPGTLRSRSRSKPTKLERSVPGSDSPVMGNAAAFGAQALQGFLALPEAIEKGVRTVNPLIMGMEHLAGHPLPGPTLGADIRTITHADELLKQYPVAGTVGGFAGAFATPLPLPGLGMLPRLAQHAIHGGIGAGAFGAAEAINQPGAPDWGKVLQHGASNIPGGMVVGGALGTIADKLVEAIAQRKSDAWIKLLQQARQAQQDAFEHQYDVAPGGEQKVSGQRSGPYAQEPEPPGSDPGADPNTPGSDPGSHREPLKGHGVTPPGQTPDDDSWRFFVHEESRLATDQEQGLLTPLFNKKIALDKVQAKLDSAHQQLAQELKLKMRTVRKQYTPADWVRIQQEMAGAKYRVQRNSNWFVETHIKQRMPKDHQFTGTTIKDKFAEVEELRGARDKAQASYDAERGAVRKQVPREERIFFRHRGYDMSVYHTTLQKKIFANAADQARYDRLVDDANKARPDEPDYSHAGMGNALAVALKTNVDLQANLQKAGVWDYVDKVFLRAAKAGSGKTAINIVGPLTTVFHVVNAAAKEARASGVDVKVAELFPRVLALMKAKGGSPELNGSYARKLSGTLINSGIIGMHDSDFAWNRDAYLAAREKLLLNQRVPNRTEREMLASMTPDEFKKTGLPGWTRQQVEKEAAAREMDAGYKKDVTGRIERLRASGAKADNNILLRVLLQDMEMLSPRENLDAFRTVAGKVQGGLSIHQFLGDHRLEQLHGWEFFMSQAADSPVLTGKALVNYVVNPLARQYAHALTGEGYQQRLLNDQDKFAIGKWFDDVINNPIQRFMLSKGPVGQLAWNIRTANLGELVKTGASALIAAERVAKDTRYPNGVNQFMKDYLDTAQGKSIAAARRPILARAEIESLRDRNDKILHMPAGPLRERTIVQRNASLSGLAAMTRGPITQMHVLAGYADEFGVAIGKGDVVKATHAVRKLVFAHVVIAFEAGTYALPVYTWSLLNVVAPKQSAELKKLFRDIHSLNPTGRISEELGPGWNPVLEKGSFYMLSIAQNVYKTFNLTTLHKDEDHRQLFTAVAQVLAASGLSQIAGVGTGDLMFCYRHMLDGMKGRQEVSFYDETKGLAGLVHGEGARLAKRSFPSTPWVGIADWLFQGERNQIAAVRQKVQQTHEKKILQRVEHNLEQLPRLFK